MKQEIVHLALLVRDYDEALHFYTQRLGFKVTEDTTEDTVFVSERMAMGTCGCGLELSQRRKSA